MHYSKALLAAAASRTAMSIEQARTVLGVTSASSADAVKKAFRNQALKLHPDVNPSEEARMRFLEARRAFEIALPAAGKEPSQFGGGESSTTSRPAPDKEDPRWSWGNFSSAQSSGWSRQPERTASEERELRQRAMQEQRARKEEKLRRRQEAIERKAARARNAAEQAAAAWEGAASELGLRRGALLVAEEHLTGTQNKVVILLLEVHVGIARGVVISGGIDGQADARAEWTVLYESSTAAVSTDSEILTFKGDSGEWSCLAEERLTKAAALHMHGHLTASGITSIAVAGYVRWQPAMKLAMEVKQGDWSVVAWGPFSAQAWLQSCSKDVRWCSHLWEQLRFVNKAD